jgi:hypothetical protein
VSKILFLTREDKSHIFKPPCIRVIYRVYIVPTPKQKIVKFHAQKQIGKSHVNMENISLCISQYLMTLYYIIKINMCITVKGNHKMHNDIFHNQILPLFEMTMFRTGNIPYI